MINYETIIQELNRMMCPIHHKHVTTVIPTDDEDPIFLNCCCIDFEQQLLKRYYQLIDMAIDED